MVKITCRKCGCVVWTNGENADSKCGNCNAICCAANRYWIPIDEPIKELELKNGLTFVKKEVLEEHEKIIGGN